MAGCALAPRESSVRLPGGLSMSADSVVLASGSPRRTELLSQLGVEHEVAPANIDETPEPFEAALTYVQRMARAKAAASVAQLVRGQLTLSEDNNRLADDKIVLAADTIVIVDGAILGKPRDEQDGLGMLARLSGRSHQVATAVCLRRSVRQASVCVRTEVSFRSVSLQEARGYWASGEPRDKAGGYGIQGVASAFVNKIDGSYSSVIGLPLVETRALLLAMGYDFKARGPELS